MNKHLIAAALALILVLAVALSAAAVVMEATHDCTGIDCHICEILKTIIDIVRTVSLTAVLILLYMIIGSPQRLTRLFSADLICFSTPVSEKIRLLN